MFLGPEEIMFARRQREEEDELEVVETERKQAKEQAVRNKAERERKRDQRIGGEFRVWHGLHVEVKRRCWTLQPLQLVGMVLRARL